MKLHPTETPIGYPQNLYAEHVVLCFLKTWSFRKKIVKICLEVNHYGQKPPYTENSIYNHMGAKFHWCRAHDCLLKIV